MFEFLLEPIIDTYYFGCPSSCIVPNGDTHQMLKIIFTPLVSIVVGIGAVIGLLAVSGRLPNLESLRSISIRRKVEPSDDPNVEPESSYPAREPKTIKQYEKAIKKEQKNDFLSKLDEMDSNPDTAFSKFLELQDDHPLTESLEVVRTEAKEEVIVTPEVKMVDEKEQEFYTDNKKELEKQAKQITELMKSENLTEEEAIDKIIQEMPTEVKVEEVEEAVKPKVEDDEVDMDTDIFKQDIVKKEPKHLKFLHTQFKKKEKPEYRFSLNELGSTRRDQYAKQIEAKLQDWALPLPKYEGKNQDYQLDSEIVKAELKKFALFLSMGEMMADKRKSKKTYWEKVRIN